jgi:hypothetical protein
MSSAIAQLDGHHVARFRGLFAGLSIIAKNDEEAAMASWVPLASGGSRIYQVHQDEWTATRGAASIGGWLTKNSEAPTAALTSAYKAHEKAARRDKHSPPLDPSALWKASEWLVGAFLSISVQDLLAQLKTVMPFKLWPETKPLVAQWPHIANYWLLAHWAFGNHEELAETIEKARDHSHPATVEIRSFVAGGTDTGLESFRGIRERFTTLAPGRGLSAAAKKRKKELEKQRLEKSADFIAAEQELVKDPGAAQALKMFEQLKIMAKEGAPTALKELFAFREQKPKTMRVFAKAIDKRWRPILLYHQRLAACVPDKHKLAIPGLILGLAAMSENYQGFRDTIESLGRVSFGIDRRAEYAVAIGEFIDEAEARKWLLDQATAWADRIHEWDLLPSPAFKLVLLKHDLPETHGLIEKVLRCPTIHGGNHLIISQTAVASVGFTIPGLRDRQIEILESAQRQYPVNLAFGQEIARALEKLAAP